MIEKDTDKYCIQQSFLLIAKGKTFFMHYHICRVTRSSRFVIQNLTFAAFGHHSSLWPKATIFERSQRAYLQPEAATVHCGLGPQHLKYHLTGTIRLPCIYWPSPCKNEVTRFRPARFGLHAANSNKVTETII